MNYGKGSLLEAHISMKDSIKGSINIGNHVIVVAQQCLTYRMLEKKT